MSHHITLYYMYYMLSCDIICYYITRLRVLRASGVADAGRHGPGRLGAGGDLGHNNDDNNNKCNNNVNHNNNNDNNNDTHNDNNNNNNSHDTI